MESKSNDLRIKQMLNVYANEINLGSAGKSIRWLQNTLPWQNFNLEEELPQFRKKLSGSFDGRDDLSTVEKKFNSLQSLVPLDSLIELSESSIGKPHSFKIISKRGDEVCVDGNDLTLIYFATRIAGFWQNTHQDPPARILDIGGGYGGLAAKLAKIFPSAKITLIDSPEGNLLQRFYLHTVFSDIETKFDTQQSETASIFDTKFSIIPIRQFELLYEVEWDLVINTRSMQEMNPEDVASYFDMIQNKLHVGGIFFNANQLVGGAAGMPYHISRSPYDNFWALLSANPNLIQVDNFEICTLRLDFENQLLRKYLKTLPTNNIWRSGLWAYRCKPLMLVDQLGASYLPKIWLPLKKMTRFFRQKSIEKKYKKVQKFLVNYLKFSK